MKWYEKFDIGQRVRVIKKVDFWHYDGLYGGGIVAWQREMDKTIGNIFEIVGIDIDVGYRLETKHTNDWNYNFCYPAESLQGLVGEQLLFNFMQE